ncbi:MAG: hypothetical protein GQ564_16205 [Bacteroidales bacterium]|nr:hypothetical protein [Bacteroidales bacterium]
MSRNYKFHYPEDYIYSSARDYSEETLILNDPFESIDFNTSTSPSL